MIIKSTTEQIMDLSVDLGTSMVKGATRKGADIITAKIPNRTQVNNPANKSQCRYVEVQGEQGIYIGIGKLNNNVAKHSRENLLEQVIAMANEFYGDTKRLMINLKLGLPFKLYDNDKFVNELKSKFKTNTWIDYKFNDETDKSLYINKIEVHIEGYSAFESIIDKVGIQQRILLLDVGGETTDLASFTYNYETNEYDTDDVFTVEKGVISLVGEITKAINDSIGGDIESGHIDNLLRAGQTTVFYAGADHRIVDYIGAIDKSVKDMVNEITNQFGSLDNYCIVGLGGGFDVFNTIANQYIKANIELNSDSRFYANAIGYLGE